MAAEQEYKIRNKHMLVVSGLLGFLTVILFLWHDHRIRTENEQDMVEVLCAYKDLAVGEKLAAESMTRTRIPQSLVPTEVLSDIALARDEKPLLNMELNQEVTAGRIIRWSYVTAGVSPGGTAALPRVGYRLVPLEVKKDTCPPLLATGTYVDLKCTLPGDSKATTLMEKVLVKAVNGIGSAGATSKNIDQVSLEIREADADKLAAFMSLKSNKIVLWVRNPMEERTFPGFNPELEKLLQKLQGAGSGGGRD